MDYRFRPSRRPFPLPLGVSVPKLRPRGRTESAAKRAIAVRGCFACRYDGSRLTWVRKRIKLLAEVSRSDDDVKVLHTCIEQTRDAHHPKNEAGHLGHAVCRVATCRDVSDAFIRVCPKDVLVYDVPPHAKGGTVRLRHVALLELRGEYSKSLESGVGKPEVRRWWPCYRR